MALLREFGPLFCAWTGRGSGRSAVRWAHAVWTGARSGARVFGRSVLCQLNVKCLPPTAQGLKLDPVAGFPRVVRKLRREVLGGRWHLRRGQGRVSGPKGAFTVRKNRFWGQMGPFGLKRGLLGRFREVVAALRRVVLALRRVALTLRRVVAVPRRVVAGLRRVVAGLRRVVAALRRVVAELRRVVMALRPHLFRGFPAFPRPFGPVAGGPDPRRRISLHFSHPW